jgi:hypothetical protein
MDSHFVGTWKRTLEIQGSGRSAEYVPPAVAGRSAEKYYCSDGWKYSKQFQTIPMMEKEKIMIEIITIPMEDAVALAKAILAAEDAEDVEEAVMDVVEKETIVSI